MSLQQQQMLLRCRFQNVRGKQFIVNDILTF